MNTGVIGEDTMCGRTVRMDGTGAGIAGMDGTVMALAGAANAGTDSIGTGRRGAVITGMVTDETGIERAVTALAVITAAGIRRRRTCTLLMSICRASICTSCFHCNDGRGTIARSVLWSVPHAHHSILYRGRIR